MAANVQDTETTTSRQWAESEATTRETGSRATLTQIRLEQKTHTRGTVYIAFQRESVLPQTDCRRTARRAVSAEMLSAAAQIREQVVEQVHNKSK